MSVASSSTPRWRGVGMIAPRAQHELTLHLAPGPALIATITHGEVIRKILQHLKLAVDPPPIASARVRQEAFTWSSA